MKAAWSILGSARVLVLLCGPLACHGSRGGAHADSSVVGDTWAAEDAGGIDTGGDLDSLHRCASPGALMGASWTKTNWPGENTYLQLFAADDVVLARTWDSLNGGRVFLTADKGTSWTISSAAETDIDILSMVLLKDDNILAATWGNSYRSRSGGTSWDGTGRAGIPEDTALRSLTLIDSLLWAGTTGSIFKSSDDGDTWTEVKAGLPPDATVLSIVGHGETLFAGTDSRGVFVSQDGGVSWAAANSGLADLRISQLALLGTRLLAVTLNGVFLSDDGGTSWAADPSTLKGVNGYLVLEDQLLAGTEAQGAYFSSDHGTTWTPLGSGWPEGTRVWSLAAGRTDLYAGTDSGIWRASCE